MAKNASLIIYSIFSFVGLLFLLLGVFGIVSTSSKIVLLQTYPTKAFFSLGFQAYPGTEYDCSQMPIVVPYINNETGGTRLPTQEEKDSAEGQKKLCLETIKQNRENAKVNDLSSSFLFLTLGAGILAGNKFFRKLIY